MDLSIQQFAIIELPKGQIFHRIQRIKKRKLSRVVNGMILPPAGILAGRFCLSDGVTAYLADSEETALYEAVFRRDLKAYVPLDILREKELRTYASGTGLRLIDIRGAEERYPVLHSVRIQHTQAFAEDCYRGKYDGILYSSAQHSTHACMCLFEKGAKKMDLVNSLPLVKPDTEILLRAVVEAARRTGVEIT